MKRPHSVGYFSSYDRGLECLLGMWLKIREQVPDATLDIYYGWDSFDKANKGNTERMRWKWGIIKKLHELKAHGVTEHGRVSHEELAQKMKEIQVWAYPTEFTEIHCITALKAQEAGCYPIVTEVAALKETVINGYLVKTDDIYSNETAQNEFIGAVVRTFASSTGNPLYRTDLSVPNRYWSDVAKVWSEACA